MTSTPNPLRTAVSGTGGSLGSVASDGTASGRSLSTNGRATGPPTATTVALQRMAQNADLMTPSPQQPQLSPRQQYTAHTPFDIDGGQNVSSSEFGDDQLTASERRLRQEARERTLAEELSRVAAWAQPFGLDADLFHKHEAGQLYGAGPVQLGPKWSRAVSLLSLLWPLLAAFNPAFAGFVLSIPLTPGMCVAGKESHPLNLTLADCVVCNYGSATIALAPGAIHEFVLYAIIGIVLLSITSLTVLVFKIRDRSLLLASRGVYSAKVERTQTTIILTVIVLLLGGGSFVYSTLLSYLQDYYALYPSVSRAPFCHGVWLHAFRAREVHDSSFYVSHTISSLTAMFPLVLALLKLNTMITNPYDVVGATSIVQSKDLGFQYFAGVRFLIEIPDVERTYRDLMRRLVDQAPAKCTGCGHMCRVRRSLQVFKGYVPPTWNSHEHELVIVMLIICHSNGLVRRITGKAAPKSVPVPVSEPLTREQLRRVRKMLRLLESTALHTDPPPFPDAE